MLIHLLHSDSTLYIQITTTGFLPTVTPPYIFCFLISVECVNDIDCPNDRACVSQKCIDPCLQDSPCASSAKCSVNQHEVECSCSSGEHGDPKVACLAIGCLSNDECPPERACINQKCQDPCKPNPCGLGALCINQDHNFTCSCPLGHHGRPTIACRPPVTACVVDQDCGIGLWDAQMTASAQTCWLAWRDTVLIPVTVERMPSVKLLTIVQCVPVPQTIQEIPILLATLVR
ncbi:Cadherin-related tumor suppressor [Portunus trituberculatus]|uniref:Cadherin-related tumor suppressor n=1 Tax=Portunus trituberculatus TaxID=210409 RepID=A0A5B7JN41_PORTR|nr:Cadherin-related tumor suppressor [Portunus trituberculatus]